jgi:hypothetical protein
MSLDGQTQSIKNKPHINKEVCFYCSRARGHRLRQSKPRRALYIRRFDMSLRWWETKRKRNEKGHFVKKERSLWRELWWKVKKTSSKVVDAIKKSPIVPGSKSD